jgi:hypothetical protein
MLTHAIFIRPDSELIRDSVCACAKLFVDEESTWHKSNRGIEQKHSRCFYAKTTQKGGFSKLCVKRKKKILYRPTPFFNT